jgi:hypothetical protein
MSSYRKASIRQLSSDAYELDLGVTQGRLHRNPEDGRWMIGADPLEERLAEYEGQEVVLIVASLEDDRPLSVKVCRTCGTEYRGTACPRCREARIRLRGR